ELALEEALVNAIIHGCGNDASKLVECSVTSSDSGQVTIVVRDPGPGFDPDPGRGREPVFSPRARPLPDRAADGRGVVRARGHRDPHAEGLREPYSTTTRSVAPRPKVSGWYISSAFGGGTTKVPGVVARATYAYSQTPSHSSEANASTRSSRRF